MENKKLRFKTVSKIVLALGIFLIFAGGIITTIQASNLEYMSYDTYMKQEGKDITPATEDKVLDVAISDNWKTLGLNLPTNHIDYKINNDLENEIRVHYQTALTQQNEPMVILGLDHQEVYDENKSTQVSEPVITTTSTTYESNDGTDMMKLWLEQIKEGVFLTEGPRFEDNFTATVELNQAAYDKLDVTSARYDRIILK